MWRYLCLHEAFMRAALDAKLAPEILAELASFHQRQLRDMQHERLIHLIVMLFVGLFFLLSIGMLLFYAALPVMAFSTLLLLLLSAYLIHYFRLENGVQRWYHIANQLDERLGRPGACYQQEQWRSNFLANARDR